MQRVHLGILATSLLVSACGGDGHGLGAADPVSDSFPITAGNGVEVARKSYEAAIASGGFAEVGTLPVASAGSGDGAQIAIMAAGPEDIMLDVISMVPFGPIVEGCLGGTGTVSYSGDIANVETITVGDTFSVEYESCDDGAGNVTDGLIEMTVTDFSGDLFLQTYMLATDVVVTNLQVITLDDTVIGNGDATVTIDTTQTPYVSTSVSGSRMSTSSSLHGSQVLLDYGSTHTLDGNQVPAEFTMSAYGTLDSSDLPADVDYSTPTTFRGLVPAFPHEGVLLAEGDNSTARLTVLDAEMVRVEIDEDADGVVDYSEDMTWEAFLGVGDT